MHNVGHFDPFWETKEIRALDGIDSSQGLADLALIILLKMKRAGRSIGQICGPISTGGLGNKIENLRRFHHAIAVAKKNGLFIFDQMPFEGVIGRLGARHEHRKEYCTDILTIFYAQVFGSGMIKKAYFLPDWQTSTGSKWEREHLATIGIIIAEYPPEWMHEVMMLHHGQQST